MTYRPEPDERIADALEGIDYKLGQIVELLTPSVAAKPPAVVVNKDLLAEARVGDDVPDPTQRLDKPHNLMQAAINAVSDKWAAERALTQLTLRKLITKLEQLTPEVEVHGIGEANSYRGYYTDLAFETTGQEKASDLLARVRSCVSKVFEGYKGGDYRMGLDTPIWIADYSYTGRALVGLEVVVDPKTTGHVSAIVVPITRQEEALS